MIWVRWEGAVVCPARRGGAVEGFPLSGSRGVWVAAPWADVTRGLLHVLASQQLQLDEPADRASVKSRVVYILNRGDRATTGRRNKREGFRPTLGCYR